MLATTAVPAGAAKDYDGQDLGAHMSFATAVAIYVLIPLAVIVVVALLVLAPGWTRSAKPGADDDGTLIVGGATDARAISPDRARELASGVDGSASEGGVSGRW